MTSRYKQNLNFSQYTCYQSFTRYTKMKKKEKKESVKNANLVSATDLNAAVINTACLKRREQMLNGPDTCPRPAQRRAKRRILSVPDRSGYSRHLASDASDNKIPALTRCLREKFRSHCFTGMESDTCANDLGR